MGELRAIPAERRKSRRGIIAEIQGGKTFARGRSGFEDKGEIVVLDGNRAISYKAFADAKQRIIHFLKQHGHMTMQEAKTLFGLTRKYVVPLMELMDDCGVTRREGNVRYLGRSPN